GVLSWLGSFAVIFWQYRRMPSSERTQAAPTEGRAPTTAVTDIDSPAAGSARAAEAPTAVAQASAPMPAAMPTSSCSNPNALGVSRVVEIDTTGGPGFGFEHFKAHDFLREGEV